MPSLIHAQDSDMNQSGLLHGAGPQALRALGLSLTIHHMTPPPFQNFFLDPDASRPSLGPGAEMRQHHSGYPKQALPDRL